MKKLVCLMVLVFTFFISTIKLNASSTVDLTPIICLQYGDVSSYLKVDGFDIISSTVNPNILGKYEVIYSNGEYNLKRDVIITSEEVLCNNGYINVKKDYAWYNNESLLKAYDFDGERVLLFDKGDSLKLMINFQYTVNLDVSDIISFDLKKYNDCYYFTATFYSEVTTYDIYICKINDKGEITNERIISGKLVDIVSGIFISDDIYLYGNTTSNNGDFFHNAKATDSFVIKLDSGSLEILKYYDFSVDYTDSILGMFNDKNPIVVQSCQVNGVNAFKYFYLNKPDDFRYIITFHNNEVIDFKYNSKQGFLLNKSKNDNGQYEVTLYRINNDLVYRVVDNYSDDFTKPLELYVANNFVSILYKSINIVSANSDYYYLRNVYQNGFINNVMGEYQDESSFEFIENTNTVLSGNYQYIHTVIKCDDLGSKDLQYPNRIKHPTIYYNDDLLEYNYDSKLNYDINLFGKYDLDYVYDTEDFELIISKKLDVMPYVNVNSGEIYNIGYILKFNGEAHLNDVLVNSNFELLDDGDYILTLTGKDAEKIEIEFKIRNQMNDIEDITIENTECSKEEKITNEYENKVNMEVTKNLTVPRKDISLIYILIPASILLIEAVIYLVIRRHFV